MSKMNTSDLAKEVRESVDSLLKDLTSFAEHIADLLEVLNSCPKTRARGQTKQGIGCLKKKKSPPKTRS